MRYFACYEFYVFEASRVLHVDEALIVAEFEHLPVLSVEHPFCVWLVDTGGNAFIVDEEDVLDLVLRLRSLLDQDLLKSVHHLEFHLALFLFVFGGITNLMEIGECERDVVDRFIFFVAAPRDEPRGPIRVRHASGVEIDQLREFIVVRLLLERFVLPASCNSSIQYHKIIVFLRLNRLLH